MASLQDLLLSGQQLDPKMKQNIIVSNIAQNLTNTGQRRPLTSLADALNVGLNSQRARTHSTVQDILMQRQEDRLQNQEKRLSGQASNKAEVMETINTIVSYPEGEGGATFEMKVKALNRMGVEGRKAAQELIANRAAMRNFNDPLAGTSIDLRTFKALYPEGTTEEFNEWSLNRKNASSPKINIPGEPRYGRINEKYAEQLMTDKKEIQQKAISLKSLEDSHELLENPEMITGFAADWRLAFAKAANLVGANNTELIANTETYMRSMGRQTAEIIKAFGSGTGLSDADREYAEGIAGGSIKLSKESMKRLVKLARKYYKMGVKAHNRNADTFHESDTEGALMMDFRVPVYEDPEKEESKPVVPDGWTIELIEE